MLDEILFQMCVPQLSPFIEPVPPDEPSDGGPFASALAVVVCVSSTALALIALVAP